jgi:hypothetical protein
MIISMKNMTWKKFGIRLVNYFLVIILIGAVISCSSRKVETEKKDSKEVTKVDSIAKIVEKQVIKIDTKTDIEESETIYIPIDSTSDFIIDGKTYKNVQISHRKKKDNTIIAEVKTIDKKQDIAVKKAVNSKLQSNVKSVDKQGLPIIAKIGILLGLILLFVGGSYLYIKK